MDRISSFKMAFLSVFCLWTITSNAQYNKTEVTVKTIEHNRIGKIHFYNAFDKVESQIVKLAGSNLLPVQFQGWDDKIVVSTENGSHTSASIIYDTQKIYLEVGLANDGSSDITQTFSNKLYIDDILEVTLSVDSLKAGYGMGFDIEGKILSAGTHTFRIVVDANNDIAETDETDNEYTRTITVTHNPICSNLTPHQHDGWDDKIVLSTVTETNTSDSVFYDNQIIYLDWAVVNNGTCDISTSFSTKVYVDNAEVSNLEVPELGADYVLSKPDIAIGPLASGSHTFKVVSDANGNVTETNESDNEYARTITVSTAVCSDVNVTPYQPAGWDDRIVLSRVSGTNTSASTFYENQNIYLDWAAINNGTCDISETFSTKIYVDDTLISAFDDDGLGADDTLSRSDINIGKLAKGTHTFRVVCDANGNVTETNESDNEYSRTITVDTAVCSDVNVTPYQPMDWDDKIVLSTVSGTNTTDSTFYDNQNIYLDWAVINNGTCEISDTFYTKVYVDDGLVATYYVDVLESDFYAYMDDLNIGSLPAGSHTFRIVGDANDNVAETDEADNEYTITISVLSLSTGTESIENLAAIKVYPNPVSDELVIELEGNKKTIHFEILNSLGQIIYSSELKEKTIVRTTSFIPGFYIMNFNDGKNFILKKMLKE
jgi:subtilase family serine protease